jgi:proline dehydrogenase
VTSEPTTPTHTAETPGARATSVRGSVRTTMRERRARLRMTARQVARLAGRAYVAGPSPADALTAAGELAARGYGVTIGYWNESDASPQDVADSAHVALAGLAGCRGDRYLSLKAPALAFSTSVVSKLLEESRSAGVPLHLDALSPDDAEPTFELLERLVAQEGAASGLSTTLPARWARSSTDVERCIGLGLPVRVVRGQWADHAGGDSDPARGYLDLVDRLAGRARLVRIATHDLHLAEASLRYLRARRTPAELEVLWGPAAARVLRSRIAREVSVRVYVPYGEPTLPYSLREACERPRMLAWLLRDVVVHDQLGRFPSRRG